MSTESDPRPTDASIGSTGIPGQPAAASPVRERTLRHMRQLLARAASTGAAIGLVGCGGGIACDPVPMPYSVDCNNLTSQRLSQVVSCSGTWAQDNQGLTIVLTAWESPDNLTFASDPVLEGATLDGSARAESQLTFICTPSAGATAVTIAIPMKCSNNTIGTLRLRIDLSGTHQPGDYVVVQTLE